MNNGYYVALYMKAHEFLKGTYVEQDYSFIIEHNGLPGLHATHSPVNFVDSQKRIA